MKKGAYLNGGCHDMIQDERDLILNRKFTGYANTSTGMKGKQVAACVEERSRILLFLHGGERVDGGRFQILR